MSGTITALTVQKNNKERVSVFIDNTYTLAVTLNVALSLKKGHYLSDQQIAQLTFNDEIDKGFEKALNYLSYRARTRQEVETHLQQKGIPPEVVPPILKRLADDNYLNDTDFGKMWVEDRSRLNPKGEQALRYELRQKGLDEETINQALNTIDEESLAWQAISKPLKQWQHLNQQTFRKKITGYLARRGFSYQTIETTFHRAWETITAPPANTDESSC